MNRKRNLFLFEYPDDGGGAGAAAPAAEAGAVPPADIPSSSGEPVSEGLPSPEAAAPAWANDPTFRDAVAQEAQAIARAELERWQSAQQQPGEQPEQQADPFSAEAFDPWSDNFGQSLAGAFQAMQQQILAGVQQAVAPLRQSHEQQAASEAQQQVQDMHHAIVAQHGELPVPAEQQAAARELTLAIASQLAPQEIERYGPGPRAVEAAIQRAHMQVAQLLTASGAAAVDQFKNQLGTLGGAPAEPQGTPGATGGVPSPYLDERDVASRYAQRG